MSDSGDRKPGGFDGEEATEVLPLPRAPNKTIEMRAPPTFDEPPPAEDEDGPLRKYLAPRVLAVQPVPDQRPEDLKIVINVRTPAPSEAPVATPAPSPTAEPSPDAKLDAERARRRAPTVRIARGTLAAQGMLPSAEGAIDVSFDDESDAPGSAVSRSGGERREGGSGKLIALGVGATVLLGGAVVAALVLTGTLSLPDAARSPREPSPEPPPSAAASAEPAGSAAPSAVGVDPPPAASESPSAAPSSSAASSTQPGAPPRRFTPPPRPYRPPTKVNPTTL
jgi:hypothetical protein